MQLLPVAVGNPRHGGQCETADQRAVWYEDEALENLELAPRRAAEQHEDRLRFVELARTATSRGATRGSIGVRRARSCSGRNPSLVDGPVEAEGP